MEIGIYSFAERISDPHTGATLSPEARVREILEEIELADQVGLDLYGLGEHHREDFVAASPALVLAAAAARTKRIRLSSAVTVISSSDPVRVFEDFSTLDLISGGRAEIMVGRGSFVESFPLYGLDLADYDELFDEKLGLLRLLNQHERVTWSGAHRPALTDQPVHPRPVQDELPVWVGVGGTPASALRAGRLGLPIALGIIGGDVRRFAPLLDLYRDEYARAGHDPAAMRVSVNAHGFVADTAERALDLVAPYTAHAMQQFLRLPASSLPTSDYYRAEQEQLSGALVAGTPEQVAEKIVYQRDLFGLDRYLLQFSVGTVPHREVMRSIELLGTEVAPLVRAETATETAVEELVGASFDPSPDRVGASFGPAATREDA